MKEVATMKTGGAIAAIVPKDLSEIMQLSSMIVRSGMAPKDMNTAEKVAIAMMKGLEAGLSPMDAIQSVAVINGTPSIWGDAALALVLASGLLEDIEEIYEENGGNKTAVCTVKRKGIKTPDVCRFSVQDAKTARLWGKAGPWTQYPDRMLKMRARAFALRGRFMDVIKGLSIAEEVQDIASAGASAKADPINIRELSGQEPEPVVEDAEIVDEDAASQASPLSGAQAQDALTKITAAQTAEDVEEWLEEYTDTLKATPDAPLKDAIRTALKNAKARAVSHET